MLNAMHKLEMTLKELNSDRTVRIARIETQLAESGYKQSNEPPKYGYMPNDICLGADKHYWYKGSFRTPPAEENTDYYLSVETDARGWDALNPQFILYLNGEMTQGFDTNHRDALLRPDTEYEMYNYAYSSDCTAFRTEHSIVKLYRRIEKLYYDLIVPLDACRRVYRESSTEYSVTMRILEEAVNLIDLRERYSKTYFDSIERAIEYMESEYYGKLCSPDGKPRVNCIGHTHIDVEWKWDRFVTKEKIQRSFATAKALMDEYPEYLFMLSQPELYRYLKEEAPEKFEELRELVRLGRWEPEGAMFVESDCNLVSGESFVRQILKGTEFFRREFGKECKILFLPDVFGYSAALPQILKKSGVDYFITSKISWNDTNTLPYDTFIWEGIDGTEIFTTFITGQSYDKGKGCARGTTYVGNNDSDFIYGTWERQAQKAYVSGALNTYGYGDGGGGPSKDMLEKLRRLMRGLPGFPVATTELLLPFMERQERDFLENAKKLRRTPKWVGELYLEFHRGTYTTMADNKRDNRRSELALVKCEALGYTDLLFGGSYPEKELNDAWLTVLHDQFHDILPGSSIEGVYKLSAEDYKRVLSLTEKLTDEKLRAIAARLDTDGGVLVYNPLGFARRGRITVGGKSYVTGEKIPALGYKVIKPVPGESGISAKRGVLENDIYDIRLDRAGRITSVYDKRFCREVLSGAASEIRFYEDYPHEYDAWEIDKDYGTKMYILDTDAAESIIYDGDRTGIRYEQKYMSSTVYHTVWLTEGSPRIDIEVEVDWHEKHQLMKLAFPLAVRSQSATFEIQYGHTQRPTHRNTSWDEAKFEVCAHKWMDISETGYGVAILNDSKYGHSVEGQTVTVTCLRAPTEPNANADMGKHKFTVSLLPHEGDIKNGKVIEAAYDLNQPLIAMQIPAAHGDLSESFSLAESSSPSVIIECAKKAEDSDDLILRLYEAHNSKTETTISVHPDFKICHLCDLLERPVRVLPVRDGKVTLSMRNFEIETLRFSKG